MHWVVWLASRSYELDSRCERCYQVSVIWLTQQKTERTGKTNDEAACAGQTGMNARCCGAHLPSVLTSLHRPMHVTSGASASRLNLNPPLHERDKSSFIHHHPDRHHSSVLYHLRKWFSTGQICCTGLRGSTKTTGNLQTMGGVPQKTSVARYRMLDTLFGTMKTAKDC